LGYQAYVHVSNEKCQKLHAKIQKCILIGYNDKVKGYKIFHPTTRRVFMSRNIVFDELSLLGIKTETNSQSFQEWSSSPNSTLDIINFENEFPFLISTQSQNSFHHDQGPPISVLSDTANQENQSSPLQDHPTSSHPPSIEDKSPLINSDTQNHDNVDDLDHPESSYSNQTDEPINSPIQESQPTLEEKRILRNRQKNNCFPK
jgi:hypothetical protein